MKHLVAVAASLIVLSAVLTPCFASPDLHVTSKEVLEARGISVLLFHNSYHRYFGDQKMSGLELILHGQRIATNGDVRLSATPTQWDPIPEFKERKRGAGADELVAVCTYEKQGFAYRINVRPDPEGFRVAVQLDKPLPSALEGKAGFNLEFLPTAYFGKAYLSDKSSGIFPRHDAGPMQNDGTDSQSLPLATGTNIVLSPEDPTTRVSISSDGEPISLYDGRNAAQNGWFVVRSVIPAGKSGEVIVWHVRPNVIEGWTRPPVMGFNQVGYTPSREKVAVIELDPNYEAPKTARVLRITPEGEYREVFSGATKPWGKWMRYNYAHFDFSSVREPGLYAIEYAGQRVGPFRIAENLYDGIWALSLNTFLPEQMDHVKVREGYRIWHGASHLDDARQAPPGHVHFDGYEQGPTTDSPFAAGQHIPGLDKGGWYDAGDFDLRTQTQAGVILDLVLSKEKFGMQADDTSVDEAARYVRLRTPDGKDDVLQQVEHGIMFLLAQYRIFGHAIPGVIAPTLEQYTHLGDGASATDGRIYSEKMKSTESDGISSGIPDDRWAFTTHTTALNYDAVSALAAASRVLRGYNDKMADECLQTAVRVWEEERRSTPALFQSFNTTGSKLEHAEINATLELLIATHGGEPYKKRMNELLPAISQEFPFLGGTAVRAIPYMNKEYKDSIRATLVAFKPKMDAMLAQNPYSVPISLGTWGGSGWATRFATEMYLLHEAFPEIIGPEHTLHGIDYVLGNHPASNVSYVSGVGTRSRLIGYGNNRADYTFIPGGMIPGIVVIQPDFPELTADWPFFWYENEYVVDTVTSFIVAANAAHAQTKVRKQ